MNTYIGKNKKLFFTLGMALGATLVASLSYAATPPQSGQVVIQGTVAAQTSIYVTPVAPYNALDLATAQTDLTVANVKEVNNTTNGYTVSLVSANAGVLKNGTAGSVAYTAKYNTTSATLATTAQTVATGAASNSAVSVTKPFKISYSASDVTTLMAGTYSDTLTFSIAAN